MTIVLNNNVVGIISPRYVGREITIGIDSSKTNTGIAVGDETGRVLDVIEFNGSQDGTTKEAVLELCRKQRQVLLKLLQDAKIAAVGIEDIITKNEKGKESGITVHTSRFKITAVFMSFIFFFQEEFGITPELINNWEWKHHILPEEFRSKDIKKGSLAYFKSVGSKYSQYTDDATDSLCILKYLCLKNNITENYKVKEIEMSRNPYAMYLTSVNYDFGVRGIRVFDYNTEFTLKENADAMSNIIGRGCAAIAIVGTAGLKLSDIYTYCAGDFSYREDKLKLIVITEQ